MSLLCFVRETCRRGQPGHLGSPVFADPAKSLPRNVVAQRKQQYFHSSDCLLTQTACLAPFVAVRGLRSIGHIGLVAAIRCAMHRRQVSGQSAISLHTLLTAGFSALCFRRTPARAVRLNSLPVRTQQIEKPDAGIDQSGHDCSCHWIDGPIHGLHPGSPDFDSFRIACAS